MRYLMHHQQQRMVCSLEIPVILVRQGAQVNLTMTPRTWQGRGLLRLLYTCCSSGRKDGLKSRALFQACKKTRETFVFLQILGLLLSVLKLSVERLGSMKKYVQVVSLPSKSVFRNFNPLDSHVWLEFYGSPSDRNINLFGNVIQS